MSLLNCVLSVFTNEESAIFILSLCLFCSNKRNIAHKFYNQVIADLSVTSYGMSGNISSIIAHPYVFITMMTTIIAFSRKD